MHSGRQPYGKRAVSPVWACCVVCWSLLLFLGGCDQGYYRQGGKWAYVWFNGDGRQVRYLDNAAGKLTTLSNPKYAATSDHVYLWGIVLPDADPRTFGLLTYPYSKDAKRVYCGSVPMTNADPAEFQVLGGQLEPQVGVTAKSYEFLVGPITAVPPDTVIVGAQGWSKDGKTVYFGPNSVVGARAESFKMFDDWYGTDGGKVFCGHRTMEDADVETFRVTRLMEAEDRNHKFFKGEVIKPAK